VLRAGFEDDVALTFEGYGPEEVGITYDATGLAHDSDLATFDDQWNLTGHVDPDAIAPRIAADDELRGGTFESPESVVERQTTAQANEHRTGRKLPDGSWEPTPYSSWIDANPNV